ncbi:MAG TPA: hypothetical protein VFY11_13155, partial [Nocardioidaceae bacterium]|nr:hypothetical protein [Nocardioidaceae bacterium]
TAARVRSESERELSAATQRRDSINAQLSNVRQMLATLTGGSAVGMLADPFSEEVSEVPAQRAAESPGPDSAESDSVDSEADEAELEETQ